MIEKFLSPISKEIWFMLDYPEDWMYDSDTLNKYTIIHKPTKIGLWISNGPGFLDGYKTTVYSDVKEGKPYKTKSPSIGIIDRWILWYKVRKVMKALNHNEPMLKELQEFNESKRG